MHEQASRHDHLDYGKKSPLAVGQLDLVDVGIERGVDQVVAYLPYPGLDTVDPLQGNPQYLPGPVGNTENQRASLSIGHARQFVGNVLTIRLFHRIARQQHTLERERRVLAKANPSCQVLALHHAPRTSAGMIRR